MKEKGDKRSYLLYISRDLPNAAKSITLSLDFRIVVPRSISYRITSNFVLTPNYASTWCSNNVELRSNFFDFPIPEAYCSSPPSDRALFMSDAVLCRSWKYLWEFGSMQWRCMRISEAVRALSQCIHSMECLRRDRLIQVLPKQDVSTRLASYDSPPPCLKEKPFPKPSNGSLSGSVSRWQAMKLPCTLTLANGRFGTSSHISRTLGLSTSRNARGQPFADLLETKKDR